MKITILKEKLKEGINTIEKISQKNSALPILQNTLLEAENNLLKLTSTNLDSAINWQGLAKVEGKGKICVPIKFFSNFINSLPNKPINIEIKDLILFLECENYKIKIKGFNPEEFPIIPQLQKGDSLNVDCYTFCQSLNRVLDIPSSSLVRPEISGIFLSFDSNLIRIAATDSFRLAEKKLFLKNTLSKEYSLILSQSASKEIVGVFGDKEGELNFYFSKNQIWLKYIGSEVSQPKIDFTSRLIDGEYPNYQEIIPKKFGTHIRLLREEFLNQVKAASLFSEKIREIKILINPKTETIEILSQSPDLGEYKSTLKGDIKGNEISLSFNYRFLIDGISKIKTREILVDITNEEGPSILRPVNEEDYFYILMPIKTS